MSCFLLMLLVFSTSMGRAARSFGDQEASPINRVQADYLCTLANRPREQVAFSLPSGLQRPRIWLTGDHKLSGLEAQLQSFSYRACEACFAVEATYFFSGSRNSLRFETVSEESPVVFSRGRSPWFSQDLPPGADEDLPPGAEEPPPEPPPVDPEPNPQPSGPMLHIRYEEKSRDGRLIYQAEGRCEPLNRTPLIAVERR